MSLEDKVVHGKKSLVPDCNTLAYHKGKQISKSQLRKFLGRFF